MDHQANTKNYNESQNDFRFDNDASDRGINPELSMISCEQELYNELNRNQVDRSRSANKNKMNHSNHMNKSQMNDNRNLHTSQSNFNQMRIGNNLEASMRSHINDAPKLRGNGHHHNDIFNNQNDNKKQMFYSQMPQHNQYNNYHYNNNKNEQ